MKMKITKLRQAKGDIISNKEEIINVVAEFYDELYFNKQGTYAANYLS